MPAKAGGHMRVAGMARSYKPRPTRGGNANGPQAGRLLQQRSDQLSAASTLAVISSTEPTPAMALYFGVPSAAASCW